MSKKTNVVRFPAEPPISLTIPFDSIEALSAALDALEVAGCLARRIAGKASVHGEAAVLASARRIFAATACRLHDPGREIDPERAAAAIAWFAEQVAEQSGEETARAVAARLQAILEQTTQSAG